MTPSFIVSRSWVDSRTKNHPHLSKDSNYEPSNDLEVLMITDPRWRRYMQQELLSNLRESYLEVAGNNLYLNRHQVDDIHVRWYEQVKAYYQKRNSLPKFTFQKALCSIEDFHLRNYTSQHHAVPGLYASMCEGTLNIPSVNSLWAPRDSSIQLVWNNLYVGYLGRDPEIASAWVLDQFDKWNEQDRDRRLLDYSNQIYKEEMWSQQNSNSKSF